MAQTLNFDLVALIDRDTQNESKLSEIAVKFVDIVYSLYGWYEFERQVECVC